MRREEGGGRRGLENGQYGGRAERLLCEKLLLLQPFDAVKNTLC
jgi:hypothetical protein